jgi:hypothetical protein
MNEFVPFQKIGRLSREVIVTEKIDGTNGVIQIGEDGSFLVGSRSRWISPEQDNFGFASWAVAHRDELMALGPGRHFGEWWGQGIQRKYGLSEKRWSLFNVSRWTADNPPPACCHVVPVLARIAEFDTTAILAVMEALRMYGSVAAPRFPNPEGIVVFHTQSGALFKKTFEKDDAGKGHEQPKEMAA